MITGHYTIYLDGNRVAESDNLITNFGKATLIRYLSGNITTYAGALAVGVDSTLPALSNSDLNFELFRVPINFKSPSFSDSSIIFKATAPVGSSGSVRELGLFPFLENAISGSYQTRTLFEFSGSESWQNVAAREVENQRVGGGGIKMEVASATTATIYNTSISLDLSGYSQTDTFKLAILRYDSHCTSIDVKFTTADGNDILGTFATGSYNNENPKYEIITIPKSSFSNQGADWRNITQVEVTGHFNGAGVMSLDGMKVVDADNLNPEFGLISHSILSTPVVKSATSTMDIEYRLVVPL